ncbi:MAG: MFS transporter [Clostridia bacterium]
MAKEKTKMLQTPLRAREIATYSLGSLGREVSNNCINAFFLVYLCIYMHLNPLIMTVAFVLAKLWDAANDPMLATLVNNSRKGKMGRYRPWILFGALLNGLTIILMFTPIGTPNIALKYFYYIFMYVLWGMTFTIMDVPYWTMLPTIANSTDERNKASSMAKLIGGFGGFTIGSVGTSLILPNLANKGMEKAYLVLGVVTGALMLFFVMFTVFGNREKYDVPNEKVGLKEIFKMFKENDQLRAYAGNFILFTTGTTIALFQLLYLFVYCYEGGANLLSSKFSYTMFWVIACTGQGIAMFFYNQLTKKFPREKIYGATFIAAIASFILMFFIFFPLKAGNYWLNTILVASSGAFLMVANGMNQIGSTVMIADVVDYGEWKTGKRADSLIFSVQTLLTKFSGAVAMLILGIGISVAGLPNVREVYDPAIGGIVQQFVDNAGQVVDASTMINGGSLTILRVFMFLIPIPLCIAGYVIYKKKFWLYGEKYISIKKEVDERRFEKGFDIYGNKINNEVVESIENLDTKPEDSENRVN